MKNKVVLSTLLAVAIGIGLVGFEVTAQPFIRPLPYTAVMTMTFNASGEVYATRRAVRSDGSQADVTDGEFYGIHDVTKRIEVEYDVASKVAHIGPLVSRRVARQINVNPDCKTAFGRNNPSIVVQCEPDGEQFGHSVTKVTVTQTRPDGKTTKDVFRSIAAYGWLHLEQLSYNDAGVLAITIRATIQPGEPDLKFFEIPQDAKQTHDLVEFVIARAAARGKKLDERAIAHYQETQAQMIKEANDEGDHRFNH